MLEYHILRKNVYNVYCKRGFLVAQDFINYLSRCDMTSLEDRKNLQEMLIALENHESQKRQDRRTRNKLKIKENKNANK